MTCQDKLLVDLQCHDRNLSLVTSFVKTGDSVPDAAAHAYALMMPPLRLTDEAVPSLAVPSLH